MARKPTQTKKGKIWENKKLHTKNKQKRQKIAFLSKLSNAKAHFLFR